MSVEIKAQADCIEIIKDGKSYLLGCTEEIYDMLNVCLCGYIVNDNHDVVVSDVIELLVMLGLAESSNDNSFGHLFEQNIPILINILHSMKHVLCNMQNKSKSVQDRILEGQVLQVIQELPI